jgi:hypothetical protein
MIEAEKNAAPGVPILCREQVTQPVVNTGSLYG